MNQYKLSIHDRDYSKWTIFDANTHEMVEDIDINPAKEHLFNGDIFTYDGTKTTLINSLVRNSVQIPGVLLLEDKIYGKHKNKYIYKCSPDDKHIPIFLIAHEEKRIGFSKRKINRYITFQFKSWDSTHPEAIIKNNIGNVEEIINFYEYQLFCKSLNSSIQGFGKDAKRSINLINTKKTFDDIIEKYNIEERNVFIFSIDGPGTQDFDDAFSVQEFEDKSVLSIYITNVAIWMDVLDLWSAFSERISSIYLPDKKRPMLPTVLSNILCSLYKGEKRIALAMDIHIQNNSIIDIQYSNVAIVVNENYLYDDINTKNKHFGLLEKYANILQSIHKLSNKMNDSKEIVAYLMMFMNYHTSKIFIENDCGIFRSISDSEKSIPKEVPTSLHNFIKIWNTSSGKYTLEKSDSHELIGVDSYIHITSPMRRLIDLLNIISIQRVFNLYTFSSNADTFYDNWVNKLDYINTTTRSIRKIQLDCNLLNWCNRQTELNTKTYQGYVFDKLDRNDGLFQYIVYIRAINMASKITVRYDLKNYSQHDFSLHMFNKKDSFKKKVRLHLHSEQADSYVES